MDEISSRFRAWLLAGETVERLRRQGHSADEAKRLVAGVINAEDLALRKGRHTFDVAQFSARLRQLPDQRTAAGYSSPNLFLICAIVIIGLVSSPKLNANGAFLKYS